MKEGSVIKPYILAGVFGLAVCLGVVFIGLNADRPLMTSACDGAFTAAALVGGFGVLRLIKNGGAFDVMSYGISSTFFNHYPGARTEEGKGGFKEWQDKKMAGRKSARPQLIVGGVFLALSFVLLIFTI